MIGCLFTYFPSKIFSLLWVLQFFRQLQRNSSIYPKVNFIIYQKRQLFSYIVVDLFIYYFDRGLRLLVCTLSCVDGLLHDAYRFSGKRTIVRNDCGSSCFMRIFGSKAIFLHPIVVGKRSIPVVYYDPAYLFVHFQRHLAFISPKSAPISRGNE